VSIGAQYSHVLVSDTGVVDWRRVGSITWNISRMIAAPTVSIFSCTSVTMKSLRNSFVNRS
jgi:predicted amino acid dehydrogenase